VLHKEIIAHQINASNYLNLFLLELFLLALTPSVVLAEDTSRTVEEVFAEVLINQHPHDVVVLLRSGDRLFVGSKDLRSWRLKLPDTTALSHYGEDFYAFDALKGLSYRFDESTQALNVEAPPSLFDASQLEGTVINFNDLPPASPGGFLNYNVFSSHAQGQIMSSGFFELGGFGGWGASQTSFLVPELDGQATAIRLNTTWVRDQPVQMTSLRFGDVSSGMSRWGGNARLGGVQWATNFSTQPEYITFPQPEMSGEVALPSTVDFYVGNTLLLSKEVPSGPFSINDLPVMYNQGDMRMIVRDILGNEQVLTQPFIVSNYLLKQGLHDYSYELGFARRNFGSDSNKYGPLLAVGTHRFGFTDQFTGEAHGELLSHQQVVGFGGVLVSPAAGVLSGSLAISNSKKGVGGLLELGIYRQSDSLSFGTNTRLTSQRFTKLGMLPQEITPRHISNIFIDLGVAEYGSFSVNYGQHDYRDREVKKELTASFNRALGKFGNLRVSVSEDAEMALNLNFSMPLGKRSTVSLSTMAESGKKKTLFGVSRKKSSSSGVGYSLNAGVDDTDPLEAGVNMQNEIGNYTFDAKRFQGQTTFSGSASGGVAFLGGNTFFNRQIRDSFAVVQVPNYSGVGIYADNQLVARTDVNGNALVPILRPYQKNSVRIEQADLPFDVKIDEVQLEVVPHFRSGLLVKFPVKSSRGALLSVVLENGEPLPAGSQVQIISDKTEENEVFPTGMRGEVYLTGLTTSNQLRATWGQQSCEFALLFPETTDPLPHLGTYTCSGEEP